MFPKSTACSYAGLTREYSAGLREFIKSDGLEVLLGCLDSGIDRLVLKALFLLCSYFSSQEAKCWFKFVLWCYSTQVC